ncbi:MAG: bacillithiol system redox-active protein YtxJ [Lutibacter sp.]|jgi:bacillithiol system protein YtxJ
MNWISLTNSNQLEELIKSSVFKPVLIFKHSTRCGISRMVLKSFEREFNLNENEIDLYFLDLLNYRSLSQEISLKFNVAHQSPQVLVIKNGAVIYHDSHNAINSKDIEMVINKEQP